MPPKNAKPVPDFLELTKKYGLKFEGPALPSQWPEQHKDTFEVVWNMKNLRFDELKESLSNSPDSDEHRLTQQRVVDALTLSMSANECRALWSNEETWKVNLTSKIFNTFDQDARCLCCGNRRWISSFQALHADPVLRDRLKIRQTKRKPCVCSENDRARAFIRQYEENDHHPDNVFQVVYDMPFTYHPSDDIEVKEYCTRKPDGVYGLRRTGVFDSLLERHGDGLWTSPFGNETVLYPFLVVEWKSEQGGPGFSSIERQTAFPIRTMLRLQQHLFTRCCSRAGVNPLVWFMGNQGEDWRVYACVTDEQRFRVFHLWKGMVTLPEDAAQLLYIVDYIADWARDVYRKNVLHCLSDDSLISRLWLSRDSMETQVTRVTLDVRGRSNTTDDDRGDGQYIRHRERTTQDSASLPHIGNDVHTRTSPTPGGLFGRADTSSLFDTLDTLPGSSFRGSTPKENAVKLDSPSITPVPAEWRPRPNLNGPSRAVYVSSPEHGRPMLRSLDHSHTVSHLNFELDRFCHIRIPEDDFHLQIFVEQCKVENVRYVFEDLLDVSGGLSGLLGHARMWDVESLNMVQQLWTNCNTSIQLNESSIFAACFLYHCYLDETYGHVVREIVCLTASELALRKVYSKAGEGPYFYPLESVSLEPQELVRALREASYNDLLDHLLRPDVYHIATVQGRPEHWVASHWTYMVLPATRELPEWHPLSIVNSELFVTFDIRPQLSSFSTFFPDIRVGGELASSMTDPGALFIKLRGPKFCILVFGPDPSDLGDLQVLFQMVQQLKLKKIVIAEGHSASGHRQLIKRPMDSDDINELDKMADLIAKSDATNHVYQAQQGTSVAIHPARWTGMPEV